MARDVGRHFTLKGRLSPPFSRREISKRAKVELSSTLYILMDVTDRLQQAIQVTSWGFYRAGGMSRRLKTTISPEMALHGSQDSCSKLYKV
jgi:hypothetical protein